MHPIPTLSIGFKRCGQTTPYQLSVPHLAATTPNIITSIISGLTSTISCRPGPSISRSHIRAPHNLITRVGTCINLYRPAPSSPSTVSAIAGNISRCEPPRAYVPRHILSTRDPYIRSPRSAPSRSTNIGTLEPSSNFPPSEIGTLKIHQYRHLRAVLEPPPESPPRLAR